MVWVNNKIVFNLNVLITYKFYLGSWEMFTYNKMNVTKNRLTSQKEIFMESSVMFSYDN